jgi:hypothetical protein
MELVTKDVESEVDSHLNRLGVSNLPWSTSTANPTTLKDPVRSFNHPSIWLSS